MGDLTKDDIVDVINEYLKEKQSLNEVTVKLKSITNHLSEYDLMYIESKYCERLIELWLEESEEHIKTITRPHQLLETIQAISSVKDLWDCYKLTGSRGYSSLIRDPRNCSSLFKSFEKTCIPRFKQACLNGVIEQIDCVKSEVLFIEQCVNLLKSSKDPSKACSDLKIIDFLNGEDTDNDFKQFLLDFQKCIVKDRRVIALQKLGHDLISKDNFYLAKGLKETIGSYLEPVTVSNIFADGRAVLEVSGKYINIAKVLPEIEKEPRFLKIEEVRFVHSDVIHVNADLSRSTWHGKNIVVYSDTFIVNNTQSFVWDVSGMDGKETMIKEHGYEANVDCSFPDNDGNPGESGGNILIFVNNLENGGNLKIVSNGGHGSNGLDGCKGEDGMNGESISDFSFQRLFPPVSKVLSKKVNLEKTCESIVDCIKSVDCLYSNGNNYGKVKHVEQFLEVFSNQTTDAGSIYFEVTTDINCKILFSFYNENLSFCQSFLLFKGSEGLEGKPGEPGGRGGKGGFGGEIDIQITKKLGSNIEITSDNGKTGTAGKMGGSGKPGKCGLDKAYMDCTNTLPLIGDEWPKLFFPVEADCLTLSVKYTDTKLSNSVYTPHKNQYAQIASFKKIIRRNRIAEKDISESHLTDLKNEQNCRKKTICCESILNRYGENQCILNVNELSNSVNKVLTLIENFSSDQMDLEQTSEEVKVSRRVPYESTVNVPGNWYESIETIEFVSQLKNEKKCSDNSTTLLQLLKSHPNNFLSLMSLALVRMSLEQLQTLWEILDSAKNSTSNPLTKLNNKSLHTFFFCDKYKLAVLENFETSSFSNNDKIDTLQVCMENKTTLITKVLAVKKRQKSPDEVAAFFCNDSPEKRDEFIQICEHFIDDDSFKESIKTFIEEYGNSVTLPYRAKELMKNKHLFEKHKLKQLNTKLGPLKDLLMKPENNNLHKILVESIIEQDGQKLETFQTKMQTQKSNSYSELSNKLYSSYLREFKNHYSWVDLEDDMGNVNFEIKAAFYGCIKHIGPESRCYKHFLALHFDANILIYSRNDCNELELVYNYNEKANKLIHLLKDQNKYLELEVNVELEKMFKAHESRREINSKVMLHVDSLKDKSHFDGFLNDAPFKSTGYDGTDKTTMIYSRLSNILSQGDDVKLIQNAFDLVEDKILLGSRLEKLKLEFSGDDSMLHFMALHFKSEGTLISAKELCYVINFILMFTGDADLMKSLAWIIAAYPQSGWLVELTLYKLEVYFEQLLDLDVKLRWRKYLTNQTDKGSLMLFFEKLISIQDFHMEMEAVEEVLNLIGSIPSAHLGLEQVDISEWKYYLKDKFWAHEMKNVADWPEDQLKYICYYLLSLENTVGAKFCKKVIAIFVKHKHNGITDFDKTSIEKTLKQLTEGEICADDKLLELLTNSAICDWSELLKVQYLKSDKERNVAQLVDLIKSSGNTSEDILKNLDSIVETLDETNVILVTLKEHIKKESELQSWVEELIDYLRKNKKGSRIPPEGAISKHNCNEKFQDVIKSLFSLNDSTICNGNESFQFDDYKGCFDRVVLASVIFSIYILKGITLKDTQKLTIVTLLMSGKNILSQVSTGEGKSLIVVSVAIVKALLSQQTVDVITSSHGLAERDADEYKHIFSLFMVAVGHNCSSILEERKKTYSNCKVVYGDLANFQRDHLLDRFYNKNILGDRKFGSIIVDEVDSMLLDQSYNILYLSHEIPGMDKLEPIFIFIWKWINISGKIEEDVSTISSLKEAIRFDLFGTINIEQIKKLDTSLTETQVLSTWQYMLNEGVINNDGDFLMEVVDEVKVTVQNRPQCIHENHFRYLLRKVMERKRQLELPKHLECFVKAHLDEWINSAKNALALENNVHYVVDVERSETSTNRTANIIILDHDTGNDLVNSHWDDGLHQFLQLKHGCRLSLISLKAVFESNVSYFKQYKLLYGLSGTLGSIQDRELLIDMHNVNYVILPTSKPKMLTEHVPEVHFSSEAWMSAIIEKAYELSGSRSVLVICETVKEVLLLEASLQRFLSAKEAKREVVTYKRDYERLDVAGKIDKLKPGYIIISTNLAGRGTDIALSEELITAGGLHICLTFLPSNSRIEEQAYGRVARNGQPGSSQLIMKCVVDNLSVSKIIDLKKQRDLNENLRITSVKKHYETSVKLEEDWFELFKKKYETLQKEKHAPDDMKIILLQDCLDQWAFWLDYQSKNISSYPIESFLDGLSFAKNDYSIWSEKLGNPSHLLQLGLVCLKKKNYKTAILFFDKVIKNEPCFSEVSFYYRLYAKAKTTDLRKEDVIFDLEIARKLFKKRVDTLVLNTQIIDWFKVRDIKSNIQTDSFKEQQENVLNMYMVFLDSIDRVLGCGIDFQPQVEYIIDDLIKNKVITRLQINNSVFVKDLQFVESYGITPQKMFDFIEGKECKEFDLKMFTKSCPLPSKELFWKELREQQVLINEVKYVFADMNRLKIVCPVLKSENINSIKIDMIPNIKNMIWLHSNSSIDDTASELVFRKDELLDQIGVAKYKLLKSKGILRCNRYATFVNTCTNASFRHFDSISFDDFKNFGICEATAADIIDELKINQVIMEDTKIKRRFSLLLQSADEVKDFELLKCKAYSEDVKSLLSFCFSFNLAMKELLHSFTTSGKLNIPLKTKPHMQIVYGLIEHNIVKSVVNPKSNYNNVLEALCREEMSYKEWKELFIDINDEEKKELIVSGLIEHKWLIKSNSWSPSLVTDNKYKLQTDKDGKLVNPSKLSLAFHGETETVECVLSNYLEKITKKDEFVSCLNQAEGLITNVETPGFVLKSLHDVLQNHKLPTSEIGVFHRNGLNQLLTLGEKTWSWKTKRNLSIAVVVGLAQIAVGSASSCMVLIKQGVQDLIHCVNCMFTGVFHWKDYFINKFISLVDIFRTPLSKVFSNSFAENVQFTFQSAKNVCSAVIDSTKSLIKCNKTEVLKQVVTRVAKALGISVISNTFHSVMESHIEKLSRFLVGLFDNCIDTAIKAHSVVESAKTLFRVLGKDHSDKVTKKVCVEVAKEYQASRNLIWNKTVNRVFCIYKTASVVLKKSKTYTLSNCKDILDSLYKLVNMIETLLKVDKNSFLNPIDSIFDELEKRIQVETSIATSNKVIEENPLEETEETDKEFEFVLQFKNMVKTVLSTLLYEKVISPVICKVEDYVINHYTEFTNKKCYTLFSNNEVAEITTAKGKCFGNKKPNSPKNSGPAPTFLDRQYDKCLLQIFKTRRCNRALAEMLKRNTEIDVSCLDFCCSVIPAVLKNKGINVPNLEFVVDRNGKKEVYNTINGRSGSLTVNIFTNESALFNIQSNTFLVKGFLKAVLDLLPSNPQLQLSAEYLLEQILSALESDSFDGHANGTNEKWTEEDNYNIKSIDNNSSYQHSHPDGRWTLNRNVDVDVREEMRVLERTEPLINHVEYHIHNGFTVALKKVNNHIHKVQSHLKPNFVLTLDNFMKSEHEITTPTSTDLNMFHCRVVEYMLLMPLKILNRRALVNFSITLKLKNEVGEIQPLNPHGPHIVYEIKPASGAKHMDLGVKGHVLLSKKCISDRLIVKDCHVAGDLILPTGFKLTSFDTRRKCDVLILGDSVLRYMCDYIQEPLWKITVIPNLERDAQSTIFKLVQDFKEIKCIILHLGTSLVNLNQATNDQIVRNLKCTINQVGTCFRDAKIVLFSLHQRKLAEGRHNGTILKVNSLVKIYCESKEMVYFETSRIICPDDLEMNGTDLNRKGYKKLIKCINQISKKYIRS